MKLKGSKFILTITISQSVDEIERFDLIPGRHILLVVHFIWNNNFSFPNSSPPPPPLHSSLTAPFISLVTRVLSLVCGWGYING